MRVSVAVAVSVGVFVFVVVAVSVGVVVPVGGAVIAEGNSDVLFKGVAASIETTVGIGVETGAFAQAASNIKRTEQNKEMCFIAFYLVVSIQNRRISD